MEIKINFVENHEEAKLVNLFLNKLIKEEKKADENINENHIVSSLYEKFFDKEDVCLLVAKTEEKIVGYLYGFLTNKGDVYLNQCAQLNAIFVDENYRKNNIGTKLIESFKNWCKTKNVKHIELKVNKNNVKAINLYRKNGFKEVKTIMINETK